MKVLVKKRFRDADTLQLMFPGQFTEYDTERAKKLARSGYVQLLEEEADEPRVKNEYSPVVDASEKNEVDPFADQEEPEKPEVEHTPKLETIKPKGKPGRKPKK